MCIRDREFGDGALTATVAQVRPDGNRVVQFHYQGIFLEILERLGKMPLPPYIKEELRDQERYQTCLLYTSNIGYSLYCGVMVQEAFADLTN